MIVTEQQRRWWFATHPEYSWSRGRTRPHGHKEEDDEDEGTEKLSPEYVDASVDEALRYERDPVGITLLKSVKHWFGTEFASKTPEEQYQLLWGDEETDGGEYQPADQAGGDRWSGQPRGPEATIGPPPPPGLSDRARSVLDFVFPGITKAYDRWRTGYYEAYPWAPGPLYDAQGDFMGLASLGLMKIQAALAKAVNPAEIAALQNARQEVLKFWDYPNFPRGWAIEDYLGRNLPRTFKGIDDWVKPVATSNKSMHLRLKSYQDPARILSQGRKYVDQVANFRGARMGDIRITNQDIGPRVLRLGVPPGATKAQKSALKSVIKYGKQNGVKVEVIRVP